MPSIFILSFVMYLLTYAPTLLTLSIRFILMKPFFHISANKSHVKYLLVPEFTKICRVHYHAIFFNLPYIKNNKLREIWGNGFIKINRIDRVSNVGAYVSKYITKDNIKIEGMKSYFTSRGLFKPLELDKEKEIQSIVDSVPLEKLVYETSFLNDYTGIVTYKQYNLKHK